MNRPTWDLDDTRAMSVTAYFCRPKWMRVSHGLRIDEERHGQGDPVKYRKRRLRHGQKGEPLRTRGRVV